MDKWDKLFILSIVVIALFGYMDSQQIVATHNNQDWTNYNEILAPAILFLWYGVLIILGIFYYVIRKDLSEAVAVTVAPLIMLAAGLEDVLFFIFRSDWVTSQMCWFSYPPHTWINKLFGLECSNFKTLLLSSIIGIGIAYLVFQWLKRQKW